MTGEDFTADQLLGEGARPGEAGGSTWRAIREVMRRPQPVTIPMVTLFAIIPLYLFLDGLVPGRTSYVPEIALDRWIPLQPAWSVVYGSLFLAAFLPVFVVHQQELVRRTILAFLLAWLTAYACFVAYPTVTPRPADLAGEGFFPWLLRHIWASDVEGNCLPSLHVAQCFIAAWAGSRSHGLRWWRYPRSSPSSITCSTS